MQLFSLVLVSLLSASASAQLSGLPTCSQGCVRDLTTGDQIGGCGALDIACICSAKSFISDISCCVASNCNKADQQTTIGFAHQICSTAGVETPNEVDCPAAMSTFSGPFAQAAATGMSGNSSGMASAPMMTGTMTMTGTASMSMSKPTMSATAGGGASPSTAAKAGASSNSVAGLGFGFIGSLMAVLFV